MVSINLLKNAYIATEDDYKCDQYALSNERPELLSIYWKDLMMSSSYSLPSHVAYARNNEDPQYLHDYVVAHGLKCDEYLATLIGRYGDAAILDRFSEYYEDNHFYITYVCSVIAENKDVMKAYKTGDYAVYIPTEENHILRIVNRIAYIERATKQ